MFGTTLQLFPVTRITRTNHYSHSNHFHHPKISNLHLTVEDCITSLECELFELQNHYCFTGILPHICSEEIWPSSISPDSPELATWPTLSESKPLPSYSLSDARAKFQVSKPLHQHVHIASARHPIPLNKHDFTVLPNAFGTGTCAQVDCTEPLVVLPQTSWSQKAIPGSAFSMNNKLSQRPAFGSYGP